MHRGRIMDRTEKYGRSGLLVHSFPGLPVFYFQNNISSYPPSSITTALIRQLRSQGVGYRQIANQLNLSRDAVRNYCKSNNLNGYREAVQANIQRMLEDDAVCTYCGSLLEQPRTGRKKHFCNDTCRRKWWNQNRDKIRKNPDSIYGFTCKCCGKEFTAYGSPNRQYCSHECYISDRFWGGEKPAKAIDFDMSKTPSVVLLNS